MKLPEITQEILEKFGASDSFGVSVGIDTQLIEWVGHVSKLHPQWTRTAVDFARLIAQGPKASRPSGLNANANVMKIKGDEYTASMLEQCEAYIAELEVELKKTKDAAEEWRRIATYVQEEIERMRPVVEAAKYHSKYNELIGKSFCTCDICKTYREYEAKKP